ncbi:MAG TPA: NAD-glutamate dehydrogenase, partial [Alphaproteobacteria bacterium]|nr:NAD-glutamate dehydrogenase [Alphaproteobacteria bacterium]
NFKAFLSGIYQDADPKYLENNSVINLQLSAYSLYNFIATRKVSQKRMVRVFNPDEKRDGFKSERTFVEVNLNDTPFILDSITSYLFQEERILHEVLHPIFIVSRSKDGKLERINLANSSNRAEGSVESVIQIQIGHVSSEKEHREIEREIGKILECVYHAVNDFKPMTERVAKTIEAVSSLKLKTNTANEVSESAEFLRWTADGNFIFLGYRYYDYSKNRFDFNEVSDLGIFKSEISRANDPKIRAIPFNKKFIVENPSILEITKSSRKSVVHRHVHMDYISVKVYGKKGDVIGEERYLGLFTSKVYFQSAHNIPIIRQKIDNIVKKSGFRAQSHNGKALVAMLENHPRDELLQSTEDELFEMSMGIVTLSEKPATRLFIRRDRFYRYYSCIIFIPREFFTTYVRENIQKILTEDLGGSVMDYYTQVTESPLARVNILISAVPQGIASDYLDVSNLKLRDRKIDVRKIEQRIIDKTNTWIDNLSQKLSNKFGEIEGENIFRNYSKAFPENYKDIYHPGGATLDIAKIESVYNSSKLAVSFDVYHLLGDAENIFQLKLYTFENFTLSDVLPIIENIGFKAIDETGFKIKPKHQQSQVSLYHYKLTLDDADISNKEVALPALSEIKDKLEETLLQIWSKQVENDKLNMLVARAGLSARQISILRAYTKYILQLRYPYSKELMFKALCKHPQISRSIVAYFESRFDVNQKGDRQKEVEKCYNEVKRLLQKVDAVVEDRILNQFLETVRATLRTNYYQKDAEGQEKGYMSFKLSSKEVPNAPKPIPYAEIFVYSYDVEAIHLRFGKVARGGLRWSDRHEDFRTEVLGLVKAQQVKNSVIVPVGSKGGFVVKNPVKGRDEYFEQGKACYRTFLSGMLDITDNIIKEKIVRPKSVVCHDAEDPYLVVAADKGTATFSDIANDVSDRYGFWLSDAFASGGSVGYDHKKMGITARGGWISVMRHFREMGIDCQKQDFTCVGIGDMAGDVFGNGMLLSQHICLVAAFNHIHIFLDPTPDSAKSFKERQRLFALPKSTWMDYDKKLISKGGGIFERSAKSIPISKEIGELLDIKEKTLSPDDLIKKILTSRVDLIWNGGIGTYAKASSETHDQVGDKSNDALRVNANELRCKIVGEGGNLGFTQRARIEYARQGGRINTDAIDNSAGVDCSDHEVNIKIALREAVASNKITVAQRNKLLEKMTDEVGLLVLRDNELQTQALTIMENQKHKIVEDNIRLMEMLTKEGRLDRAIEFLPSNEQLQQRVNAKQGLTRPELAVLLAYSKLYIFDDLIASNLPDDPYFEKDLINYFPTQMREKFLPQIKGHQLRREIITTVVANSIVNRTGTTFYQRVKDETGLKGCDIARAYTIVRDTFGLRKIWEEIEQLGTNVSISTMKELYGEVDILIERVANWYLRNFPHPLQTGEIISDFAPKVEEVAKILESLVSKVEKDAIEAKVQKYTSQNVPKPLAYKIAILDALGSSPDIILVSRKTKLPLKVAGQVYFEVGNRFKIGWLRIEARKLFGETRWDDLAVKTLISIFYDQQMSLTEDVLKKGCDAKSCVITLEKWLESKKKLIGRYSNFIMDIQTQERITSSMLTVAVERVNGVLGG